jgi:hypothetical protein
MGVRHVRSDCQPACWWLHFAASDPSVRHYGSWCLKPGGLGPVKFAGLQSPARAGSYASIWSRRKSSLGQPWPQCIFHPCSVKLSFDVCACIRVFDATAAGAWGWVNRRGLGSDPRIGSQGRFELLDPAACPSKPLAIQALHCMYCNGGYDQNAAGLASSLHLQLSPLAAMPWSPRCSSTCFKPSRPGNDNGRRAECYSCR